MKQFEYYPVKSIHITHIKDSSWNIFNMTRNSAEKLKKKIVMNRLNSSKAAVESKDGKLPISF